MFENLIASDKSVQSENLINQVVKILSGKSSNAATLKFISQMQTGKVLDAVFTRSTPEGKGVISLNGNKLVVELPKAVPIENQEVREKPIRLPLNNGQAIRVRVESSGPRPELKIVSPDLVQDKPVSQETKTNLTHRGKSISRSIRFDNYSQTPGSSKQVISARITHIVDSKTIIADTGNRSIVVPVESTESLKPGTKVNISFEKTKDGLKPSLLEISTNNTKKIDFKSFKPYLPSRMPLVKMANLVMGEVLNSPAMSELKITPDVVVRLKDTLQLLVPTEGKLPSEKQVRQQVEYSGINYEAKVRRSIEKGHPAQKELAGDLKGLLLKLDQSADNVTKAVKTSAPFTEFRQTLKFAIDNIELNQLSTQVSKQENQPLVIQIPNPLSSGNKTIQLYVRKDFSDDDDGNNGKKNSHNVAFILDLSFLGKIKISAQISQERLSIKIDTENKAIAKYINGRTHDFEQRMREHNIVASVECCVLDKVKPENDSLIDLLVSQNTSLVNIKT